MTTALVLILAAVTMLVLAVCMTLILGWANKAFHVDVDPRIDAVNLALPGANCGGCGYVGCNEYAEAVVAGEAPPDKCPVGGDGVAAAIADILGLEIEQTWPYRPVVHCGAHMEDRLGRHEYRGERSCSAANLVAGVQGCTYGCLGMGDCEVSCPFDAIHVVDGLATVDYDKCTGCGACARVCPRNIIHMVPFKREQMVVIACSNHDFGVEVKKVCKVGCIGCKACQRLAGDLFSVEDNVSHINYEDYDPATADEQMAVALEKCPMKGIIKVGKPSARDLAAVADKDVPGIVEDEFKTTVDDADWRG